MYVDMSLGDALMRLRIEKWFGNEEERFKILCKQIMNVKL